MLDLRERRWLFEHTHMKMYSIQHQLDYTPPPLPSSGNKISPTLLFVIVIVAVLFFISGILHLLVRFLTKHHNPSSSSSAQSNIDRYPESSATNTLQRQLQQLFHLHDSGLDQTFIDSLPVFMYKELLGAKEPFDCSVCLCEFSDKDKLRMLPICSHAFHINCIDTWLLSNSTCPLCRGTLFSPGRPIQNPIFEFDDMREDEGFPSNGENGCSHYNHSKSVEMEQIGGDAILQIRLGKFRKLDDDGDDRSAVGETSSSSLDDRRCFSMGSYEYVVRDANLMVSALRHDSSDGSDGGEGKKISFGGKTDSYSESKIWLWSSNKHKLTTSFDDQERRSYLS
ncbi:RING-H2 finger protein ATL46-like [Impatiens glandulifera]|uniref:RING-H2 finger protein ATL46-like n=1 Tax=Impatiens glandulifera TaxID=253017 RepID=UPI001FB14255|nr:RING-H2 finger protein ATL46-like [Impatiens glandulifera]